MGRLPSTAANVHPRHGASSTHARTGYPVHERVPFLPLACGRAGGTRKPRRLLARQSSWQSTAGQRVQKGLTPSDKCVPGSPSRATRPAPRCQARMRAASSGRDVLNQIVESVSPGARPASSAGAAVVVDEEPERVAWSRTREAVAVLECRRNGDGRVVKNWHNRCGGARGVAAAGKRRRNSAAAPLTERLSNSAAAVSSKLCARRLDAVSRAGAGLCRRRPRVVWAVMSDASQVRGVMMAEWKAWRAKQFLVAMASAVRGRQWAWNGRQLGSEHRRGEAGRQVEWAK